MSRARDERGAVLVMAAVMIPVFLLLTALVVDVGNWFTHDRQLQNRADAGAFAAGVEYAQGWKACVYEGTDATRLAAKAATAARIADAARQYAADPEGSDYSTGVLPAALHNSEIANQANVDVVINSSNPDYNDDTDYTDGAALDVADPCYRHTPGTDPEGLSPGGGHWTDIKVKERDLPSLFRTLGLPLARAGGRARVEIRPAISGHRFLPLAVPNNIITKVQVRYYNECTGAEIPGSRQDLAPLPTQDQGAFAGAGGGQLWGIMVPNSSPPVGDKSLGFNLTLPAYSASCGDYVPVGVEVRLASRDDIDFNQSCATLLAARYADCFRRLSQIRVWNDGNPDSQPRLTNVKLTGGCTGPADAYFSVLPIAATDCRYDVSAEVNWGTRDDGNKNVEANFTVSANGTVLPLVAGSWDQNGTATYASSGGAITASPGANGVTISLNWRDNDTTHNWAGNQCTNGNNTPCKYNGSQAAHRAWVGTNGNAGAVSLVRTSQGGFVSGLPGAPFDNHRSGGGPTDCNNSDTCTVFPTVGTRAVLKTGVLTTLRIDDPQANQTLQCDPNYAQGQEFLAFRYGCEPWYGPNKWTSPWWVGSPGAQTCPDGSQWFSYNDLGAGFGVNSQGNPWQCVLTAPGVATGQVGDYMSVATNNCDNIQNNSCQNVDCNFDGNYDGKSGSPVQPWIVRADSGYPRVVNLFIVPYQASKGLVGSGDEIPVLGFASFYIMNWTGSNSNQSDPCPDTTYDHDGNSGTPDINVPAPPRGAVTGVFVEAVEYEPGPVDPNATCVEGQLTPCRVTLVR
jgi:hypothetical protein